MKIVFDTNEISPHTLPLANAIRALGEDLSYCYFRQPRDSFRSKELLGMVNGFGKVIRRGDEALPAVLGADFLIENNRKLELMGKREHPTVYTSERWFKPIRIDTMVEAEIAPRPGLSISGFFKIVFPFVWRRVRAITRILDQRRGFYYLPLGIIAAQDMARVCGLLHGDLRCLFRAPELGFESRAGGRIWAKNGNDHRYCVDRMRIWGYFVAESDSSKMDLRSSSDNTVIRVLWAGRLLPVKRVDTLIKAVNGLRNIELDIIGNGPDEVRIKRLAAGRANIHFKGLMPLSQLRMEMRRHDVYVFSSNAFEGWGAVVNEALEEGMKVIGTYEAGASATILPESNLFHAGDWRRLRELLTNPIPDVGIGGWSAKSAATALMSMYEELKKEVDGQ